MIARLYYFEETVVLKILLMIFLHSTVICGYFLRNVVFYLGVGLIEYEFLYVLCINVLPLENIIYLSCCKAYELIVYIEH